MARFLLGGLRRAMVLLVAGICLLLGGLTVLLPLPTGLPLLIVGTSLLMVESPLARRQIMGLRRRSPRVDRGMRAVEARLPAGLRRAIGARETDTTTTPIEGH